ncbi:hypothetical protein K7G98_39015, partial [Saccharothrix sp. MB29]|nr:hypothetical protein [Saccharothrix sp. MB29]
MLVPLMAAVLLEVTSAALPFHAIRDYVYGLQVRTLLEDGLGWAVLVDAAVIALLVVTGLVGSAIWTRVLVWLSAALTVAVPVL